MTYVIDVISFIYKKVEIVMTLHAVCFKFYRLIPENNYLGMVYSYICYKFYKNIFECQSFIFQYFNRILFSW